MCDNTTRVIFNKGLIKGQFHHMLKKCDYKLKPNDHHIEIP